MRLKQVKTKMIEALACVSQNALYSLSEKLRKRLVPLLGAEQGLCEIRPLLLSVLKFFLDALETSRAGMRHCLFII